MLFFSSALACSGVCIITVFLANGFQLWSAAALVLTEANREEEKYILFFFRGLRHPLLLFHFAGTGGYTPRNIVGVPNAECRARWPVPWPCRPSTKGQSVDGLFQALAASSGDYAYRSDRFPCMHRDSMETTTHQPEAGRGCSEVATPPYIFFQAWLRKMRRIRSNVISSLSITRQACSMSSR